MTVMTAGPEAPLGETLVTTMSFREAEHAGWKARADSYDAHFATITNQAIPKMLSAFDELAGRALLDVCCGPGHLAAVAVGAQAEESTMPRPWSPLPSGTTRRSRSAREMPNTYPNLTAASTPLSVPSA